MKKTVSLLGLAIALGMIAIAVLGPDGTKVQASEDHLRFGAKDCALQEVALDEGYGVSRTEIRHICGK